MLSKFAKFSLVATSLAPILLTVWFIKFCKNWILTEGWLYGATAIVLTFICWALLSLSKTQLEKVPVEITSVKTADSEIIGFILVYLLPLINESTLQVNSAVLAFVTGLFFIAVLTSHSYHFNPLIGFLGYHFYEVTIKDGIAFILISRKSIRNCKNIKVVVHVSEYMIMEA